MDTDSQARLRIDKWLWAARFFKTRANASEAVNGGKVHVNGARVKPARMVGPGDELRIRRDDFEFVVTVLGIDPRRREAARAQLLYEESKASRERRAAVAAEKREQRGHAVDYGHRPDKHSRRRLRDLKKG